jgi:hypothetical protein
LIPFLIHYKSKYAYDSISLSLGDSSKRQFIWRLATFHKRMFNEPEVSRGMEMIHSSLSKKLPWMRMGLKAMFTKRHSELYSNLVRFDASPCIAGYLASREGGLSFL